MGVVAEELLGRARKGRVRKWMHRVSGIELVLAHLGIEQGVASTPEWDREVEASLSEVKLSEDQAALLKFVDQLVSISDADVLDATDRMVHLCGDPGSGKTEAIIQSALSTARGAGKVLILCPTGQLATAYRERLF